MWIVKIDLGIESAIETLKWGRIESELHERGYATTGKLIDAVQCKELAAMYAQDERFRSSPRAAQLDQGLTGIARRCVPRRDQDCRIHRDGGQSWM